MCVLEKGDRSERIWKKATELQDEKMLLKVAFGDTVGDLVLRDIRYHELCLTNYLLQKKQPDQFKEDDKYDAALKQLLENENFEHNIFENNAIIPVTTVRDEFRALLGKNEIPNFSMYSRTVKSGHPSEKQKVSTLERCPLYRGFFRKKKMHLGETKTCPLYGGVHFIGVHFGRFYCICKSC